MLVCPTETGAPERLFGPAGAGEKGKALLLLIPLVAAVVVVVVFLLL